MIWRKNMDLTERILTALDEGPEVEDYAIDEIEVLPIEVVNARLQELGVDPTVPPAIMNFMRRANTPAQSVIEALYEHDSKEDEIERLDLNQVQAALHGAGLNYRASVERIRQLTGASDHSEEPESPTPLGEAASGGNVVPLSPPIVARASTDAASTAASIRSAPRKGNVVTEVSDKGRVFHQPAKPKRVLHWMVGTLAAVAATACLFIVDKNAAALKLENAALRAVSTLALESGTQRQEAVEAYRAPQLEEEVAAYRAAQLEEEVAAYRAAQLESGTQRQEEAVAAYRAARQEEAVAVYRAALESGTQRQEEAVAAAAAAGRQPRIKNRNERGVAAVAVKKNAGSGWTIRQP